MADPLTEKLEQRITRRSFLRGSSFAAVTLAGVTAFPIAFSAEEQAGSQKPSEEPPQDRKDGEKGGDQKTGTEGESGSGGQDNQSSGNQSADPGRVTLKDDSGREYRICPQCGSNMYRQDRTWTCENCGYSYLE